MYSYKSLYL